MNKRYKYVDVIVDVVVEVMGMVLRNIITINYFYH